MKKKPQKMKNKIIARERHTKDRECKESDAAWHVTEAKKTIQEEG